MADTLITLTVGGQGGQVESGVERHLSPRRAPN